MRRGVAAARTNRCVSATKANFLQAMIEISKIEVEELQQAQEGAEASLARVTGAGGA
jgi:hypothetical protein